MKILPAPTLALVVLALAAAGARAEQPQEAPAGQPQAGSAETATEHPTAIEQVRAYIERMKTEGKIDKSQQLWRMDLPRFPEVVFEEGKAWYWHLRTNLGTMKVLLFSERAPDHVANILYLTEVDYFDHTYFHRIITGFMAQGGCPVGTGGGGPGYEFGGEADTGLKHDKRGILSMAHREDPNTSGSQFYLFFRPAPWLDGQYAVFGEVVEGLKILSKIEERGTPEGEPTRLVVLKEAWVTVE